MTSFILNKPKSFIHLRRPLLYVCVCVCVCVYVLTYTCILSLMMRIDFPPY